VPATLDLSKTVNLVTTSEVDAAVNLSGHGRHIAYSEVVGVGVKLPHHLTFTLDSQVLRDEDPEEKTTQVLGSASLAWKARKDLQFDVGAVAGLNRAAPDMELYVGISRRF
jgi:hypothetical protein